MSIEPLKAEVTHLLADADYKVREAERSLWLGGPEEKIVAAGELTFLKRQQESLRGRLHELEACQGDSLETIFQWFREEGMLLRQRLEDWIVHAR